MHLHSLEAKASQPGLMKRKPGNWLDFNANERESKRQKWYRGEEIRGGERKKSSGNFLPLSSTVTQSNMTPVNPREAQNSRLSRNQDFLQVGRFHTALKLRPIFGLLFSTRNHGNNQQPPAKGGRPGQTEAGEELGRSGPTSDAALCSLEWWREASPSSILSNDSGSLAAWFLH